MKRGWLCCFYRNETWLTSAVSYVAHYMQTCESRRLAACLEPFLYALTPRAEEKEREAEKTA